MKITDFSKFLFSLIAILSVAFAFTSCSDDDEQSNSAVVGSWFGTHSYNNPVSGTKYNYLSLWLEEDGTGSCEYDGSGQYVCASFRYSVSGNTVRCKGTYANSDDDYGDFELILLIDGDRLIPQDRYTNFILTRDGSIET